MSSSNRPPRGQSTRSTAARPIPSERELIVVAHPAAQLRTTETGLTAAPGFAPDSLASVLDTHGARMRPLFEGAQPSGLTTTAPMATLTGPPERAPQPDLSVFFRVEADDDKLETIAESLRGDPAVQGAYVKPGAEPAQFVETPPTSFTAVQSAAVGINEMTPDATQPPTATPDFTARQTYRLAAPTGVDAIFAATMPGGRGAGVNVIDIEGCWRFTHEDLLQNQGGVAGGTVLNDPAWCNHGTAVQGEIGGDVNGFGITGIAPDAYFRGIAIGTIGSSAALVRAANLLRPGDIILIELHRAGPRSSASTGQFGYLPIEWWYDDFVAIRYATSKGVIVIEAAGNGSQNLDDPLYDQPQPGFPAAWRNPLRRNPLDSGAILVGAGAPPPGTHGRNWGPDRSRLDFSNFGAAVDAQGWGREVTTAGYGDLQGGPDENRWYTDVFSGTSSASPIVVGSVACVQGVRRSYNEPLLTPSSARALLRATGAPQTDAPGRPATQRIGNRPDIRQMIGVFVPTALTVPLFRYYNSQITDHFYTTNWNELGAGNYGWVYEGIQCYMSAQPVSGTVPLYRYWNGRIGDHFYTTNWNELGTGNYGWVFEGIQCYVYPQPGPGRAALYRYWNGAAGDHFYTTNFNELGPGKNGYVLEGVQCFVAMMVRPPEVEAEGEITSTEAVATAPDMSGNVAAAVSSMPESFAFGGRVGAVQQGGAPAIPASFVTRAATPTPNVGGQFGAAESYTVTPPPVRPPVEGVQPLSINLFFGTR